MSLPSLPEHGSSASLDPNVSLKRCPCCGGDDIRWYEGVADGQAVLALICAECQLSVRTGFLEMSGAVQDALLALDSEEEARRDPNGFAKRRWAALTARAWNKRPSIDAEAYYAMAAMSPLARPCPFCGHPEPGVVKDGPWFGVACGRGCGASLFLHDGELASTPPGQRRPNPVVRWNARASTFVPSSAVKPTPRREFTDF